MPFKLNFMVIIVAILGAILFINIFGQATFSYGPFLVELSTRIFQEGLTQFNFPPVGKINFRTHILPVKLKVSLESIDLKALENWLDEVENKEMVKKEFKEQTRTWLNIFILRVLGFGMLGGGLSILIWKHDLLWLFKGSLAGLIFTALLIIILFFSFNQEAFQDPQYVGMLEAAPWIVGLLENGLENIDQLGMELRTAAKNLDGLFSRMKGVSAWQGFPDELLVLHISDIHNNLVAIEFIEEITRLFEVDLIIDTGDISDYGTALELKLTRSISTWNLPYVFVPGNHDSPSIIQKMQDFTHVIVLTGGSVNVKGLVITGIMDPSASSGEISPQKSEEVFDYQQKLFQLVSSLERKPDIVAVHNIQLAEKVIGKVPVVLHGHDHGIKIISKNSTVIVDAGTTGAAGIRGLIGEEESPYGLSLLHFVPAENGYRLHAVDLIKLYSREKGFIIERRIIK